MNLVAKEFVAAQDPADPGVLILSRFAGAAEELNLHASIGTGGELRLSGAALKQAGAPWQVIYQGYRGESLAIATPSGAFGLILSRSGRLSGRDATAIRGVFAARGYDLQNLRMLR